MTNVALESTGEGVVKGEVDEVESISVASKGVNIYRTV